MTLNNNNLVAKFCTNVRALLKNGVNINSLFSQEWKFWSILKFRLKIDLPQKIAGFFGHNFTNFPDKTT